MTNPKSLESSDHQKAGSKALQRAGLSLFDRGRRAYFVGLNRTIKAWNQWWYIFLALAALCVMAITLIHWAPALQLEIGEIEAGRLAAIQTLLVTIGGSFIGATAIVSAMLMYALQVNVERMPHKLFRRLSTDRKILLAFVGTFSLAALVSALSMAVTQQDFIFPLFAAFWASSLILVLFGFAYRRTLDLVSPNFQLLFLVKEVERDFARWGKHADRISRSAPASSTPDETSAAGSLDMARIQFFQLFPQWIQRADEALFYAFSFALRYAQKGDYGVVTSSYGAVVAIHAHYLKAKGRTFVAANGFLDSPLTSDKLLNDTLESLRQIHREAITQGNERFIDANLQVMANLAELYLSIDYATPHLLGKTHANLAEHYLADSIKEIIPHNRPDVLMKGVRLLGRHARLCLANGGSSHIPELSKRISEIALVGVVSQHQMPVTVCAVNELNTLLFRLLQSTNSHDVRFSLQEVRRAIQQVALLVVGRTKDELLGNRHSYALGGVYSSTDPTAFPQMLRAIADQLLSADKNDHAPKQVLRNIEAWSDGLYALQKDLLLAVTAAKSGFMFEMVYWILTVTEVLARLGTAKACPPHTAKELQNAARWLVSTISWLPDDDESLAYLAPYQIHERLFECGMSLYAGDCVDAAVTVAEQLVLWGFAAGARQDGWGTLETSLYCVAVLSLRPELLAATSEAKLAACMAKHPIPQEIRQRTAREIRKKAHFGFSRGHGFGVNQAMSHENPKELAAALMKIANLLAPVADDQL